MKKLLSLSIILLISFISLFSVETMDKEAATLKKVAAILKYSQKQMDIWPGYDLTETPVVITFDNGHVYVFNMESANPSWTKQQIAGLNVLYSEKDHWGLTQSSFQPQFPLEGQSAYVFNLDHETAKTFHIFVHERYHRYEFGNFRPGPMSNAYQDHLNGENIALGKLEERILADFMNTQGKPLVQMEHLRNFVAVNSIRRGLITPKSRNWEDNQQKMEGLAEYVGYQMLDRLKLFPAYNGGKELALDLENEVSNTDYSDHAIKWRHYSVGAAMGYALDFLKVPHWKSQIEKGDKSLLELLQEAVPLSSEDILQRFDQSKIAYGLDSTLEIVAQCVHKFEEEIASHMKSYQKSPGVILEVGRPRVGLSGTGSNQRLLYLANGSTLSLTDTLSSTSEDNLWRLSLEKVPYVIKKGAGMIEFKVEPETIISIDNQTYTLQELLSQSGEKPFTHIEVHGKNSNFVSDEHEGWVDINDNGVVTISF